MHAPDTRRAARQRTISWRALVTCAALLASFVLTPTAAAGAPSAVSSATASPAAFVPDWDGHSDSTVLEYRLLTRSDVVVRVLDPSGRPVASMRIGARAAGVHHATWDGRDSSGRVLAPGTYSIRVDARPVSNAAAASSSGTPGVAALGGTTTVAGARAAAVTLQRADVALTGVALSRAAVGATGAAQRTSARFELNQPASVSAAIVDGSGRVVRTLGAGRMPAGAGSLEWDGRHADGSAAADGEYSLLVAATGGGRPTDTMRVPLRVDRVAPRSRTTARSKAGLDSAARVRFPLVVTTDERATVELRVGRRAYRIALDAGTHRLVVDGARLGLRAGSRARTVGVLVRVVDGAGNATASRPRVTVPARTARGPKVPTPTPPVQPQPPTNGGGTGAPVPVGGKWPWPIDGIVTSEFGLRDGRPHTGIDIAAPTGTPIHPVAPGTIEFIGQMGGYGNSVDVRHANGMLTRYAHMSRFGGFAVGAAVTHLDTIGEVGCTGTCTGPHLHFETRAADTPRNPRAFLTAR